MAQSADPLEARLVVASGASEHTRAPQMHQSCLGIGDGTRTGTHGQGVFLDVGIPQQGPDRMVGRSDLTQTQVPVL